MDHRMNRGALRALAAAFLDVLLATFLAVLLAVLLAGLTASCDEGGMYQGGSDSEPGWRK